jgi:hypothetical protein
MLAYKNKALCKVRTITTFLSLTSQKQHWHQEILQASTFCTELAHEFQTNHYQVQSVRIVTNPFGEYLDTTNIDTARADLLFLSELLRSTQSPKLRIRFAIGEAKTTQEIALLPELIQEFGDLCNACVNVGRDEHGILDNERIELAAEAVKKISQITQRGEGNFNFTVNFNCKPLIPYFPASYHQRELGNKFVIGLETPDLLLAALEDFNRSATSTNHNQRHHGYYGVMSRALNYHIAAIDSIVKQTSINMPFVFAGVDSSAAPSKDCTSMCAIYTAMGVAYFGAAGTIEASSLLTRVFKSVEGVDLVGFSGLMLALTEDTGLAQGTIDAQFDIRSLLTYSAVCGIGLDAVPIPGDTSIEKISALMRDTGTMAFRLNKPLTVRVFPVPGLKAGDLTSFESDDLCNCAVLAVP